MTNSMHVCGVLLLLESLELRRFMYQIPDVYFDVINTSNGDNLFYLGLLVGFLVGNVLS